MGNVFLTRIPMAQHLRERMNKWDCIKLKGFFCTAKERVTRLKRQPTEWEKIFTRFSSDKNLQGTQKIQPPENQHPNEEIVCELNRKFSKEEVQMANKNMKNCSTSLAIKEMQIKTTSSHSMFKSKNNKWW
jgi:hypothetical protein